jgi:site-specific DNA recombinase
MHASLRYLIYNRKSTKAKNRQHLSLRSQKHEAQELAQEHNLNVVRVFSASESAQKKGRPVFGEMLKFLRDGHADGIIAWHPNRLSRNSHDSAVIMELLDEGILKDLKFNNHWFQNTPQGRLMLANAFAQAKYDIEEFRSRHFTRA